MELFDVNYLRKILSENGFSFKKSLGQNFLTDSDVCPQMAAAATNSETGVIEIGPGVGVLTRELSKRAKKVVAIELDERLKKILSHTLEDCKNTEVIFADAMKTDLKKLIAEKFSDCKKVSVCANLPYYITSPIVMNLLESKLPVDSITVMVQKEAAERLCATVGTRNAGAVSVAVTYYSEPEILFGVSRKCFMPEPNVDSAVIKLKVRETPPVTLKDEAFFFKTVKCCFAQRRKTLVNTLSNTSGADKQKIRAILDSMGLPETVRTEQLSIEQLAELSNALI